MSLRKFTFEQFMKLHPCTDTSKLQAFFDTHGGSMNALDVFALPISDWDKRWVLGHRLIVGWETYLKFIVACVKDLAKLPQYRRGRHLTEIIRQLPKLSKYSRNARNAWEIRMDSAADTAHDYGKISKETYCLVQEITGAVATGEASALFDLFAEVLGEAKLLNRYQYYLRRV